MGCIGNLLWFVFGGLGLGLSWVLVGCLWCITIVGIPFGMQCFKIAGLAFFPFGKQVASSGGSVPGLIGNILWILFGGLFLALEAALVGLVFCVTIIGIPFGLQCFKLARLALSPFDTTVF